MLKILSYNKKLFFYKINFGYNLAGLKSTYIKNYYLSGISIKSNNYYLIYNKLKLFKACYI